MSPSRTSSAITSATVTAQPSRLSPRLAGEAFLLDWLVKSVLLCSLTLALLVVNFSEEYSFISQGGW